MYFVVATTFLETISSIDATILVGFFSIAANDFTTIRLLTQLSAFYGINVVYIFPPTLVFFLSAIRYVSRYRRFIVN